jgi:hypothetical protein
MQSQPLSGLYNYRIPFISSKESVYEKLSFLKDFLERYLNRFREIVE